MHTSKLTRRRLLQVGGIGALGLSLPDLLQAGARPTSDGRRGSLARVLLGDAGRCRDSRGLVYGASDKNGAYVRDRPVSPEDFGATLFHALGVAPETRLAADGFTKPASAGQPIPDLFS